MKTAQKAPETLQGIEKKLQELQKDQETGTTAQITDALSLIEKYELADQVKSLLDKEIARQKSELLYTLGRVPSTIQKPIQRPTRIENAQKKVDLLISFITEFIEKIEGLDSKEYKLYKVEAKHSPSYFVMGKHGSKDIGNEFLGREYDVQELDSQRSHALDQLQSIKSNLGIVKRSVAIMDETNDSKEERAAFDELKAKITTQEESFLKVYDTFTRLIIPKHIANKINTEKLYKEETVQAKIEEYFKGKYGLNKKDESIPDGIDPDSLDFQRKARLYQDTGRFKSAFHGMLTGIPFLQKEPVENPLLLKNIKYLPLQHPLYESLTYDNPQYPTAQAIKEKYTNS